MSDRTPNDTTARRQPTPLDDFMFDLNGFLILKNAVGPELLAELNEAFDRFPKLEFGQWSGNAQRRDYTKDAGYELHNVVEAGRPFEALIDHPSWIGFLLRYCGEQETYLRGVFIDECIASIRRTGGHHPVHAGGYRSTLRGKYLYEHGVFRCGQCNIILALNDIGPGDGPTMVIPGSHKSNFIHPLAAEYEKNEHMDSLPGAVPVYLDAGDALLFVDSLMHGGSTRTKTTGERRVTIYRYGPMWGSTYMGFQYSKELLERLTAGQRKILQPTPPNLPR